MSNSSNGTAELSPIKRALLALDEMQSRLAAIEREKREPVAIVGMGCRFPGGANNPNEFWNLLRDGRDAITEIPRDRWDAAAYYDSDPTRPEKSNTLWGGFLDQVAEFDAAFFGISPREAVSMDPQQRLFLEVSWEALEDAGCRIEQLAGSRTGVFVGIYNSDYYLLQASDPAAINAHTATGNAHSIVANRLSYLLDLRGPSLIVDTACSSSLVAIHLALQSLRNQECDLALAGGINLMLSPLSNLAASKALAMATDGRCKTFDSRADGIVRGEGCGVVALKRLSDAIANSDDIWAVIRGSAVNQDGRSNGLTAPSLLAQRDVITEALKNAGVKPSEITYVEAHGAATPLGDPIEIEALASVFEQYEMKARTCALGSVKTNIGHLEASAGIAGLIKTALCLKHKMIAPHLHFKKLNPNISFNNTPFFIPEKLVGWPASVNRRYAGVSSFSFGGTNAHVILEEASEPEIHYQQSEDQNINRSYLLALSARSETALRALASAYRDRLLTGEQGAVLLLRDVCYTASARRSHHNHRAAFVASSRDQMIERLNGFLQKDSNGSVAAGKTAARPEAIAFVYSGQGTQWFGMGRDLLRQEPVFRAAIEQCDRSFNQLAGWSLLEELTAGNQNSKLDRTDIAQPLIFAIETGLTALWRSWGINPDAVVGHSLGEVAAGHAAGVLSLDDALRIVFYRSQFMQQAEGKGRMISVDLPSNEIHSALNSTAGRLSIAAINTAESTVLSGDNEAIDELIQTLRKNGTHHRLLPVNYAFHSPQMERIADEIKDALRGLEPQPSRVAFYSTAQGGETDGRALDATYWRRNARETVRFADAINRMTEQGYKVFLEVSPHSALCGEIAQCLSKSGARARVLPSLIRNKDCRASMLKSLGVLYAIGFEIDWNSLYQKPVRSVKLPHYPWQRKRYWIESANVGIERPASKLESVEAAPPVERSFDDWLYEIQWIPKPIAGDENSVAFDTHAPHLSRIAEELEPELFRLSSASGLDRFKELAPKLDELCEAYIIQAFDQLGWNSCGDDLISTSSIASAWGVPPDNHRLLERLLEILSERGLLKKEMKKWRACQLPQTSDLEERSKRLLDGFPQFQTEITLLTSCGRRLAEVLQGKANPLDLLFPAGSLANAESLYQHSPFGETYNNLARQAVARLLDNSPNNAKHCVLEIGGGTGATAVYLLPELEGVCSEYTFTDVSKLFISRAAKKFSDYSFVDYRLLDIELDPLAQGFAAQQFDMVIATNVLHATRDLRLALDHILKILRPGGTLLLLEGIRAQYWLDLTFGLTAGWWKFTDHQLRPSHPLLSKAGWQRLLYESGFAEASAVSEGQDGAEALILARKPGIDNRRKLPSVSAPETGAWVILTDQEGIGFNLAKRLQSQQARCFLVSRAESADFSNEYSWKINTSDPESFRQLIRKVIETTGMPIRGAINLWGIEAQPVEESTEASVETLNQGVRLGCRSALYLTQALAEAGLRPSSKLWLVTRAGQFTGQGNSSLRVEQAPLWGLGRVIAMEHPELWGGLIDIDFDAEIEGAATRLFAEICQSDEEDQIAFREGKRFAARLVRRPIKEAQANDFRFREDATYLITGGLGGMGLRVAKWMIDYGARNLALISRRAASSGKVSRRIQELRETGARIIIGEVDVADKDGLAKFLDELAKSFPPLGGIIHAAGVFDDRVIAHHDWNRFEKVLSPKVAGAWNLHALTLNIPLDFFALFSSSATIFGPTGLANYAAANLFLDALAHYRRQRGLTGLSINWGPWAKTGMAEAVGSNRENQWEAVGMQTIATEKALDALKYLIAESAAQVAVMPMNWSKFIRNRSFAVGRLLEIAKREARQSEDAHPSPQQQNSLSKQLEQAAPDGRRVILIDYLKKQMTRILGLESALHLDTDQSLMDLGLDSLMAIELRNLLANALDTALPATLLFDCPTIERLADYFIRELFSHSIALQSQSEPISDNLNELLAGIEQLSEDEARRLLADLAGGLIEH